MALYDYELTVIARDEGSPLSAAMSDRGLLDPGEDPGVATLLGMPLFVEDLELGVDGDRLRALRLLFETELFEALVRSRFVELVAWLWKIAEVIEPLTMFVPSGSDARPPAARSGDLFWDLPALVRSGEPSVAHPIVYYSEALAGGALCRPRPRIDYYEVECRPGIGCLYLFVAKTEAGAEILESGAVQQELLAQITS